MADEGFKRKLTAILSADVIGYSRLMRDDEEATVRDIAAHRVLISDVIKQHNGRVVDSPGDNILAEFASVVDAVNGAIKIQQEIKKRNADTPEDRRMEFRIGVNLGDVIEEEERIYGDGVNIAARVEGLAAGGGIAISGIVYDSIKDKLSLGYHYLGEQEVKNIPEPVRIYHLLTEPEDAGKLIGAEKKASKRGWLWIAAAAIVVAIVGLGIWHFYMRRPAVEPASVDKMTFPLPEKPSIAVLPFGNMSGDPKEDYFSDGLTEQIITSLSKYPRLFVIARQSSFYYKDKPVKVQQVAEELGVQYVLEGSVQKSGDQLRITAQLIDALAGHHIWSERYDRELKDIFDLQDDITINVMNNLVAELTEGEQVRRWTEKRVTNLKALEKHYQAQGFFCRHTKEDYEKARPLFEEAIALEPKFIYPYVYLGYLHNLTGYLGYSESPAKSYQTALELAQKALAIDDSHDGAHALMASCYNVRRQYDKALSEAERAIALNPNSSDGYLVMASALGYSGRWEESAIYAQKYLRINPFPGAYVYSILGRAYFMMAQYEESIATWKKALKVSPNYLTAHRFLAACYSSIGRDGEARAAANEVLRINPKFTIESYEKRLGYKNKSDIKREVTALHKAGLPYEPPLPLPDKPSIAVLAFDNLSGDPEQEYFSDGIAEDIITALSKTPKLFVIARNSSFTYKGKPVKVQKVGRELGVRYVLEGSVRMAEGKVRITAQLIDAKTGHHLWAELYDRDLKDIFDIHDEITKKIITALRVHLTEGEIARVLDRHTNNIHAYMKILEGSGYFDEDKYSEGMKCFEDAIALDPQCASAHAWLSWAHIINVWFGPRATREQSLKKAFELAEKCKALDHTHGGCYGALSHAYLMKRDYDKAISEGKRAVELDPNISKWAVQYGWALRSVGRYEDALLEYKKALRLNPLDKARPLEQICTTYNMMRRHEEAIETCKKVIELSPRSLPSYINLAVAYGELDQKDEAREAADKVLKIYPNFSMDSFEKTLPYKNKADRDLYVNGLRKAGLK